MNLKEKLAALKAEAAALLAKMNGTEWSEADAARATEVAKEAAEIEATLKSMDAAAAALREFGAPTQDSADEVPAAPNASKGRTLGEQFVNSDGYASFKERFGSTGVVPKGTPVDFHMKDAKSARFTEKLLTSPVTGNAAPVRTDEVDDLVYRPERTLLDEITTGTTALPWFEYRQIVSKTNNAKIVPEATATDDDNALKPLSTLTTATAQAKAFTYADGMEVTNQELADDGVIRTLIDQTLRENLEIEVENVLLNGDADADVKGILNTTGVLHQAFNTDVPTSLRKAITLLRTTSGAQIQGVLLNPEDDETWDLLKDAQDRYLGAGPFGTGPSTAWGFRRITSQAIEVGQAVIGDFKTVHLLQKDPLEILAFNQHKDYAQRNLTYIRAEMRALQLIRNAAKLAVVDLVAGA